jgi:hypothetical protein
MDSSFNESVSTNPFSDNDVLIIDNNLNELTTQLTNQSNTKSNTKSNIKSSFNLKNFNDKSFKLNNKNSSAYIIKEGLITRTLLPIIKNKDREMRVQYIRLVFILINLIFIYIVY